MITLKSIMYIVTDCMLIGAVLIVIGSIWLYFRMITESSTAYLQSPIGEVVVPRKGLFRVGGKFYGYNMVVTYKEADYHVKYLSKKPIDYRSMRVSHSKPKKEFMQVSDAYIKQKYLKPILVSLITLYISMTVLMCIIYL